MSTPEEWLMIHKHHKLCLSLVDLFGLTPANSEFYLVQECHPNDQQPGCRCHPTPVPHRHPLPTKLSRSHAYFGMPSMARSRNEAQYQLGVGEYGSLCLPVGSSCVKLTVSVCCWTGSNMYFLRMSIIDVRSLLATLKVGWFCSCYGTLCQNMSSLSCCIVLLHDVLKP